MSDLQETVIAHLPFLRRYARALLGSQESGDHYVRQCLEALVAEPDSLLASSNPRAELYRHFHTVYAPFERLDPANDSKAEEPLERRLAELPPRNRELLLLTAVEGFGIEEAAHIIDVDAATAQRLLAGARAEFRRQTPTTVLIIEDEPVIALSLSEILREAGHTVCGVASTRAEAVRVAAKNKPGLVLADIQLRDGSSGIDAVRDILSDMAVPVVFITAFPERLLTGEQLEPTYLVTKPFSPNAVIVTVSQALLTRTPSKSSAAA